MRAILTAIVAVVWLGACSPDTDSQQSLEQEAQEPASQLPLPDVVVSAAMWHAKELETESPGEARAVYESVIKRHSSVWCDGGPVAFICADEARSRLRILECLETKGSPSTAASPAALAEAIVHALSENNPIALLEHAACDFSFGPCYSDAGANDVPEPAITCLTRIASSPAQLELASVTPEIQVWGRLSSSPALTLIFGRADASAAWVWNGICYDRDNPCSSK